MCPARNPPTAATATTPAIAARISSGFRFLAGLAAGPFDNCPPWGTVGAAWVNSAGGSGATAAGRAGFGTRFDDPHCGQLSTPPARLCGASISAPHCPHLNSIIAHLPFAPDRGLDNTCNAQAILLSVLAARAVRLPARRQLSRGSFISYQPTEGSRHRLSAFHHPPLEQTLPAALYVVAMPLLRSDNQIVKRLDHQGRL